MTEEQAVRDQDEKEFIAEQSDDSYTVWMFQPEPTEKDKENKT